MKTRLTLSLVALSAVAAAAAVRRVTVDVEQGKVRARRAFYAPVLATVRYGESLEAGPAKEGWLPVSVSGRPGWLHESAVASTAGKVRAGRWSGGDAASQDEVTLAGKGFNDEVERSYRSAHVDLDYSAVDAMERRTVGDGALVAFMRAGATLPQGAR